MDDDQVLRTVWRAKARLGSRSPYQPECPQSRHGSCDSGEAV